MKSPVALSIAIFYAVSLQLLGQGTSPTPLTIQVAGVARHALVFAPALQPKRR